MIGIKQIIKRILKGVDYTDSSELYISYLKKCGIKIGEGVCVFDPKHILIDFSRPELIEIGNNVFLHRGTSILTHDWASWTFVNKYHEFIPSHAKIKIGNNVWLGENVTILKGVEIGDDVIVGYGSVVTKSIPSNSVAIGIPAKVVSSLDDYFAKRKEKYVDEAVEFAKAIIAAGREPKIEDFYDDYPSFVDGNNYTEYNYPYERVFAHKDDFEKWKKTHRAPFNGFEEFMKYVMNSNKGKYDN